LFSELKINYVYRKNWYSQENITQKRRDINEISEIDGETYRSLRNAGFAAAIGTLLAGPVGTVAGAVLAGGQRRRSIFSIEFKNQDKIIFYESEVWANKELRRIADEKAAEALLKASI
jgi:hypothetical protein